jgi:hypothetical protein
VPDSIPAYLHRLVDDAAIFPPGEAPLPDAVAAHRGHRRSAHADLVGPLVIDDRRLPSLTGLTGGDPLAISLVVSGGVGAVGPAVTWASRTEDVELVAVEFALRDEEDLAHNARRLTTAVDQLLADGDLSDEIAVYVEPPRLTHAEPSHGWLAALDEIAAADHRLKLRTGGLGAGAVPSTDELATCIEHALDRELRFKCTAGLHHAVRTTDPDTGAAQHGFLNVLLATRASLEGRGHPDVVAVLEETDPDALTRDLDPGRAASARRWFTSFGTCSVQEPLDDLVRLGLLASHDV